MSYLPNDLTLSTTLDNTQVQADLAALDTAISGNLTELNFSSATRVPNSMLASPKVEEIIVLNYQFGSFVGAGAALTTGNKSAAGIQGTATYTILGARLTYNMTAGTPAAGNTFTVLAGNYNGTSFTTTSTIVNTTSLYTAVGAVNGSSDLTLTTTSVTGPITFLINFTAVNGTPPTGGLMSVALRVTRSLQ